MEVFTITVEIMIERALRSMDMRKNILFSLISGLLGRVAACYFWVLWTPKGGLNSRPQLGPFPEQIKVKVFECFHIVGWL